MSKRIQVSESVYLELDDNVRVREVCQDRQVLGISWFGKIKTTPWTKTIKLTSKTGEAHAI